VVPLGANLWLPFANPPQPETHAEPARQGGKEDQGRQVPVGRKQRRRD
jgi:hypothetical protein